MCGGRGSTCRSGVREVRRGGGGGEGVLEVLWRPDSYPFFFGLGTIACPGQDLADIRTTASDCSLHLLEKAFEVLFA